MPKQDFEQSFNKLIERQLMAGAQSPRILHIYLGDASAQSIRKARSKAPPNSFLLYLCDAATDMEALAVEADTQPGPPTLLENSITEIEALHEKIWFLVGCLNCLEIHQGVRQGMELAHKELLRRIKESAEEALLNVQHARNSLLIKLRGTLLNLPQILGAPLLKPRLCGQLPVIICGAGPSLEAQFPLLREAANKAIIIAAGRIAPKLEAAGISPDFTVQVDPETNEAAKLCATGRGCLVALTQSAPGIARLFERVLWHQAELPCTERLLEKLGSPLPRLAVGHTALVSAIDFATQELGGPEIALVGSELCLSETGDSHVSGYADDTLLGGDRLELPGCDGGTVQSTPEFQGLLNGIERYLSGKKLRIFNCSGRGARIAHTERLSLEDFLRQKTGIEKKIVFEQSPALPGANKALGSLREAFSAYSSALSRRLDAHKSLEREFETPSENHEERITRLLAHRRLQEEAMARSKAEPLLAGLPGVLADFVSDTLAAAPQPQGDEIRARNIRGLRECRFMLQLAEELGEDLGAAARQLSEKQGTGLRSPIVFESFLRMASDIIAEKTPCLAEFILNSQPQDALKRFSLYLNWQEPPHVRLLQDQGKCCDLCPPYLTMEKDSSAELAKFLVETKFEPERHAIIFPAPANYLHLLALGKKHPEAAALVVEPWPELLALLCHHSLFLHRAPRDTVIAGAHPLLPDWERICAEHISVWRKEGKEPLLFENPRCAALAELQDFHAQLKRLCRV